MQCLTLWRMRGCERVSKMERMSFSAILYIICAAALLDTLPGWVVYINYTNISNWVDWNYSKQIDMCSAVRFPFDGGNTSASHIKNITFRSAWKSGRTSPIVYASGYMCGCVCVGMLEFSPMRFLSLSLSISCSWWNYGLCNVYIFFICFYFLTVVVVPFVNAY